ncbi:FUSC family protein [Glycomyces luteolus]|uniref:FUSC family protein n=1 Tax=Glycomyces luteolus TaxID=2670330 RepID=A0A9X3PDK4_9ACTN|nr:FUSC family protein [Glycomyces luteolus]MDA1360634.1 FUSC family protein [Glycomyces luteolus]
MLNPGVRESLRRVGRDLRSWTPGEAAPVLAVRAAFGIAAAMSAVALSGQPSWGQAAVMGAWLGGVAMLTPGTRTGPSLPLLVGAAGSLGVVLGSIDQPVVLIAAAAAYAFTLTFIGSVTHVAGVTFTVSGIMFFLADHLTAHAGVLVAALAVAAGGAVQALTALLPPYYRWAEDRRALADAWLALAAEADALGADPDAPFRTEPLFEAARDLDRRRALPAAILEARRQLYAVSTSIGRTASARARADAQDRDTVEFYSEALELAARLLSHFAEQITSRPPAELDWDALLDGLSQNPMATATGTMPTEIGGLLRTLHETGGYAERITAGGDDVIADPAIAHATSTARQAIGQLRTRLHRRDPVIHHALRRAGVIALAMTIGLAWPTGHGYWIPLTAWLVLQADFSGTLTRGVTRAVGTTGGVVLASLLGLVLPQDQLWLSLIVLSYALIAYLTRPVSMLAFAAAVSGFTVFQIDLAGESPVIAAFDRGACTLVGAALAIGFYVLVPTWQTRRLGDLLGDLVDAYRDYARLSLDRQAHPADYDRKVMHAAIDRIRARRAALTSAADQAKAEPVAGPGPLSADVLGAEAALSRAGRALVAVNATLGRDEKAKGLAGVDAFADSLDTAYLRLAALARGAAPPRGIDLSEAVQRLDLRLAAIEDRDTRTRRSVLRWESDNMVEALDDAALLMADWND